MFKTAAIVVLVILVVAFIACCAWAFYDKERAAQEHLDKLHDRNRYKEKDDMP